MTTIRFYRIAVLVFLILAGVYTARAQDSKPEVFVIVEDMPRFPGCENSDSLPSNKEKDACGFRLLQEYLMSNIHYPQEAIDACERGTVYIQFVVLENGAIADAGVVRGVSDILDAEALRVVNGMPVWKPGYQKGKAVRTAFTLPIKFALEEEDCISADEWVSRGFKAQAEGNASQALSYFIKALNRDGNHGRAYYGLGLSHISLGNRLEACKAFEKAKESGDEKAGKALNDYCRLGE